MRLLFKKKKRFDIKRFVFLKIKKKKKKLLAKKKESNYIIYSEKKYVFIWKWNILFKRPILLR